ncbi:MAG TPA: BlaI/MecI/CopY family transcriptional regulator [Chitinophagaceae bacterium]|jgi:predicted transcriptional regulator|nr:BlaI/MecI/CopY family transcriptional regulator [Chitinophagaceae bacterium]
MKRLSEKEEAIMKVVWQMGPVFSKEVRETLPEPKPHINTVATIMRRLSDKGFLNFEDFGGSYRYAAAVSQKHYNNTVVKPLVKGLFGNSIKNAVTFFAEEEDISLKELKEIIKMIEEKKS